MFRFIETESRMLVTRGWREREWGLVCSGYRVSIWKDEKVLEMNAGEFSTT